MTYFAFCIHNHQPVGNFGFVLEEAYEKSYWPFLKALSKYPKIKLTLHTSGFLLDWIIENRPEYIELLKSMVSSGQVEIMGGGYYEPVLQVLPERDRISQINMFSDRIGDVFGCRPRGIWLAERVWEPALPTTLKKAGIEYLLVDDFHFIKSGFSKEELGGYYITEDQGNVVKVFPGSEMLRYLIPFKPVDAVREHLRSLKGFLTKGGNAAIYGDDGEKFGVWPGTHRWVYDEGWLEGFFKEIEASLAWLSPVTLSEYLDAEDSRGRVYLPTTSYMEMGEWSLPAEASKAYSGLIEEVKSWNGGERVKRFLQGGTWRNFFAKYPESNWMHKRMLLVSRELKEIKDAFPVDETIEAAERLLYRAQCNDAYWHGIFGGLYLPHLRTAVYENLLGAQNLLEGLKGTRAGAEIIMTDLDADGHEEVIIRTKDLNLFLSPHSGGALFELDFKPKAVNLSNTLTRWLEGYHHKLEEEAPEGGNAGAKSIHDIVIVKEKGLKRYLKFDSFRSASFVERAIGERDTLADFFGGACAGELPGRYEAALRDSGLILTGSLNAAGEALTVTKAFKPGGHNSFTVDYTVERALDKPSGAVLPFRFGVELNLMLPCCDGPACFYGFNGLTPENDDIGLGSTGEIQGLTKISLADKLTGVVLTVELDTPATLWRHPVHTVSLSEAGFEKIYQGSRLLFLFPMRAADARLDAGFRVTVEELYGHRP